MYITVMQRYITVMQDGSGAALGAKVL